MPALQELVRLRRAEDDEGDDHDDDRELRADDERGGSPSRHGSTSARPPRPARDLRRSPAATSLAHAAPPDATGSRLRSASIAPVISPTISRRSASSRRRTPWTRPRRITWMSSATSKTISRSWLTRTTALPGLAELADDGDDLLRLAVAERRGRLVEEDDAAVLLHGAGDRDALPLAAREHADRHPHRRDAHLQRRERIGGAVDHGAAVGEDPGAAERPAEIHVRRDVEALDQRQVLEDDGDAVLACLGRTRRASTGRPSMSTSPESTG